MNCFYHNDMTAVGICKSCNRGICKNCAVVIGEGIACKDKCEQDVDAINKILKRHALSYQAAATSHKMNSYTYGLVGVGLLILGIFGLQTAENKTMSYIGMFLGILFLVGAFKSFNSARKLNEVAK